MLAEAELSPLQAASRLDFSRNWVAVCFQSSLHSFFFSLVSRSLQLFSRRPNGSSSVDRSVPQVKI